MTAKVAVELLPRYPIDRAQPIPWTLYCELQKTVCALTKSVRVERTLPSAAFDLDAVLALFETWKSARRGLTQTDAGKILGIHHPHISALMRNRASTRPFAQNAKERGTPNLSYCAFIKGGPPSSADSRPRQSPQSPKLPGSLTRVPRESSQMVLPYFRRKP
jgi:hypothetical protein